jgi:hypothetical protein
MIDLACGIDPSAGADDTDAEQIASRPRDRRVHLRVLSFGIRFETDVRLGYEALHELRLRQMARDM